MGQGLSLRLTPVEHRAGLPFPYVPAMKTTLLPTLLLAVTATATATLAPASPALAAQQPEEPAVTAATVGTIDLETAQQAVDAALAACEAMGVKMNVAVVDAGANLVAFARMDGAWLGSTDIAIKKAKTARFFDMPTGDIGQLSQPGGPLFEIESSNDGLITFPGGVPIRNAAGEVIGAIGVSGSTVDDDHAVAMAGLGAVQPEQPTAETSMD